MGNLNPFTWIAPNMPGNVLGNIFNSLSQWLLNPQFPYGIGLGNVPGITPAGATMTQMALQTVAFTSAAQSFQTVIHGVTIGAVLLCEAYGQGNSLEHVKVPVVDVDATYVYMDTSAIPSGRGCHFALLFTPDPTKRGW